MHESIAQRVAGQLSTFSFPSSGSASAARTAAASVTVTPEEKLGLCTLPAAPLLDKPENGAALNTEMVFGEPFKVLGYSAAGNFTHVKLLTNGEEGFIDVPYAKLPTEEYLRGLDRVPPTVLRDTIGIAIGPNLRILHIPGGSYLPDYNTAERTFSFRTDSGVVEYRLDQGRTDTFAGLSPREQFVGAALVNEDAQYGWGRRTIMTGFDCSGLLVTSGAWIGLILPHGSGAIQKRLEAVESIERAETGDFLFYSSKEGGRVRHVGVLLRDQEGGTQILHASGMVKRQPIDSDGVYNPAADRKLSGIGRLI